MGIKFDFVNSESGLSIDDCYARLSSVAINSEVCYVSFAYYKDKASRDAGMTSIFSDSFSISDPELCSEIKRLVYESGAAVVPLGEEV